MNTDQLRTLLDEICREIGRHDDFPDLRSVDAKVAEVRSAFAAFPGLDDLAREMREHEDFGTNSRRVRLDALRHVVNRAQRMLRMGTLKADRRVAPAPDLTMLVASVPGLKAILDARWSEAQQCMHAGLYLSAVVLMGSILEALLLAKASTNLQASCSARAAPKDRAGHQIAIQDWTLSQLIDVAVEVGWLRYDRGRFGHALRESRNVVHPWVQVKSSVSFDEGTCRTCWSVLEASVADLLR